MNSRRTVKEMDRKVEKDGDGKIKAAQRTKEYFQTLTKKSVRSLYNMYKIDFEMFQYSVDEFL